MGRRRPRHPRKEVPVPKVAIIQIGVTDLDEAVAWYREKLGFEQVECNLHPVAAELEHDGCRILLHRSERKARIDYPNDAQTLICFGSDDLAATLDELKSKGVDLIHDAPERFPDGLFAAFRDPYGNVHEIVEYRTG